MAELAAQYGYASTFFNSDPELKKLISDAVRGQWNTNVFQGRFMNTKWYQARTASQRQWADLTTRDPKEAARKINDTKLTLGNRLSQMGLNMNANDLNWVANTSLSEGWTEEHTKQMLAVYVNYQGGGPASGTPATLEMQIKSLANDYGMKATNNQLTDWVNGMLNGRYTQDNVTDFLKDMAKSKYAGMSNFLDQGMTVKQVAQPYLQSYANILETAPDAVDLNDNLIQQALQGQPAEPGKPPAMQSVYQFERQLRRDPRWMGTKNARDQVTSAGNNILKDWGLVG